MPTKFKAPFQRGFFYIRFIGFSLTLLNSYTPSLYAQDQGKADSIINQTIDLYGGQSMDAIHYSFRFRDMKYEVFRRDGLFEYSRQFKEKGKVVLDKLNNQGFNRWVSGKKLTLDSHLTGKYTNALNSVIYFTMIPYVLNDKAVNKIYLGMDSIKDQVYHQIEVYFSIENGGTDFEDRYVYWINVENHLIDYFAYSFHVNEGGMRFREVIQRTRRKGLIFQDYANYQLESTSVGLSELGKEFEKNKLQLVSVIRTESIRLKSMR